MLNLKKVHLVGVFIQVIIDDVRNHEPKIQQHFVVKNTHSEYVILRAKNKHSEYVILRAKNKHSEYVILIAFTLHNGYRNAPQYYVVRTLPVLFLPRL
jgi:folate-dependent phosphoribosylglycinamide formyltransferase PurN